MPRNANKEKLSNYSINIGAAGEYIDANTSLDTSYTSLTLSAWVKYDSLVNYEGTLFGQWIANAFSSSTLLAYVEPSGVNKVFKVYWGPTTSNPLISTTALQTDVWYHIVITWDGNNIKLFINGTEEDSQVKTSINNSTQTLKIGAYINASQTAYVGELNGQVSQACLFDYALDSTQINYLYNLNNPMVISGGEPVAYWPLGDNSNPTANAGYPNISVGADSVFDFNGSQAIDVPAVDLGVNGSISMWFNPETGGRADVGLVGEGSQGFDYVIRSSSGVFIILIGSTFYQFAGFGSNVVTGGWNFLVLTKSAGNVNLYLKNSNGEFSVSRTESNWASASLKFDRIGARTITPINLGFQGEISNFQAWDSVLLPTEITTLYNNGQPLMTGTQPQATNLKAWYKLNQYDSYWDLGGNGKWTFNNAAQPFDFVGLLDTYTSAKIAYSLRKLDSNYTGNAIRVRRSSDNSEQDIGFTNNELDTTSLLSFVGSNDGYVTTWYDQSGNTNNATHNNASTQPLIVSSGVVNTINSKPSIKFNGIAKLNISTNNFGQSNSVPYTILTVSNMTSLPSDTATNGGSHIFGIGSASNGYFTDYGDKIGFAYNGGSPVTNYTSGKPSQQVLQDTNIVSLNSTQLSIYTRGSGTNTLSSNNNTPVTNTQTANPYLYSQASIGASSGNNYAGSGVSPLIGNISECILWWTNFNSDRTDIKNNLNSFYTIY